MKRLIKFFILLISVSIIIYTALGYKLNQRNEISSVQSYVVKDSISVGTGEYGYIIELFKSVGSPVEKGEQLYGYIPLEEKDTSSINNNNSKAVVNLTQATRPQEEVINLKKVKSPVKGILKQIYFPNGSYVTRDDKVMEVQLESFLIRSTLKMEPKDFELLKSDKPVIITLPNGQKVGGRIVYIHPEYDFVNKEVIVDSSIDEEIDYLFDGTPVELVLERDDAMYIKYSEFNNSILEIVNKFGNQVKKIFSN